MSIIRNIATTALIAWLAAAPAAKAQSMQQVDYEYTEEIFNNPERGLFKHIDFMASGTNLMTVNQLNGYRNSGFTLVYNGYIMDSFRDGRDVSTAFKRRIRTNMERLRQTGMKAVVRFYYSADSNNKPWDVAPEVAELHISQLKPLLEEFADVIAVVEAGFVGVWGEWAFTENYNTSSGATDYAARARVVEALADAVPTERFISLRTPMAKRGVLGLNATDTITAATAYDGSLRSRLGFHNDCFLANADDAGTYQNSRSNRIYTLADSRYTPMGGETCSTPNSYTAVNNALAAFRDYHWSYLNADYHPECISDWNTKGFLDVIKRHLGYRFALTEGSFSTEVTAGGTLQANIDIENVGWAAPYNPRGVELVLVAEADREQRHTFVLPLDPRRWAAGTITKVEATVDVPETLAEGRYSLYLNLPDTAATIHDRPEYSIRLANKDCWDAELGMNLLTTITVTADAGVATPIAAPSIDCNTPIYDLAGRRVGTVGSHTELTEGIYIIGGMKVARRLIDAFNW